MDTLRRLISHPAAGHLAAFFTIFVWGVTFASTKVLLTDFTPVEVMFYRLVLAALALSLFSQPRLPGAMPTLQSLRAEWRIMAAGLCGVTLFFILQNSALIYTLSANVSVLLSVSPLLTALISRAVLGERLKTHFFLGFSLAITGIILIAFNGSVVLKLNPLGDLLSLLAALVWALYNVLIKSVSGQAGGNPFALTRKVFYYGLLFLLPLLPLFQFRFGLERLSEPANLLNLLFLGVVASALCYVTWNFAVQRLGPVKTIAYIYLVPFVTIAVSALALNEPVTLMAAAGMLLILAGMAISEREKALSHGVHRDH